jgi:hypothetical protein
MAAAVDLKSNFFSGQPGAATPFSTIGGAISVLLPNVIIACGILFFLLIIYGGYQLIVLGGQWNLSPQKVTQAKTMTYYGAIGFLLVLSAYFILQITGVITGINFLNPPVT